MKQLLCGRDRFTSYETNEEYNIEQQQQQQQEHQQEQHNCCLNWLETMKKTKTIHIYIYKQTSE